MLTTVSSRRVRIYVLSACALYAGALPAAGSNTRTLENLERERAQLIATVLSGSLDAVERAERIKSKTRQMVDMERMVMRDDRLLGASSPQVRRAFGNYDLTFLVHASIENQRYIVDHWLEQQGLNSAAILAAKRVRR